MEIKLMQDPILKEEYNAIIECLKSKQYTQGKLVKELEENFAKWNGSKYAVMVNSGSSANLLMISVLKEKYGLKDGDEVLVPAVTWPTTIYPIIQNNLIPVFCDCDESYNLSVSSMKKMVSGKTKALFLVHVLGQPANMDEIVNFCKENNLILLEDSCEALGAIYKGSKVGTFGLMSSFSFYFGHHITTIEGGMITTNDEELADGLKSYRSHGWIKESKRIDKYKSNYENLNFVFDMLGYNLRSTDLNASIGLVQLKKADSFIKQRRKNHSLFLSLLFNEKRIFPQKVNIDETSSFSLGIMLSSKSDRDYLLGKLPSKGIECRPIIAGNLLKQPVFTESKRELKSDKCSYADKIHEQGLYLPNNQFMDESQVRYMVESVISLLDEKNIDDKGYGKL